MRSSALLRRCLQRLKCRNRFETRNATFTFTVPMFHGADAASWAVERVWGQLGPLN